MQYDKDLLEVWDEAKRLRCEWFNDYEKTASKPPMVIADLDVIQLDFRGRFGNRNTHVQTYSTYFCLAHALGVVLSCDVWRFCHKHGQHHILAMVIILELRKGNVQVAL